MQNNNKKPSRRKKIIAGGLLFIFAAYLYTVLTYEPKSDPESEKIIRQIAASQLNKDPNELTDKDFAQITEFDLSEYRIWPRNPLISVSDIILLEKFTNLHTLNLAGLKLTQKAAPKWMTILAKLRLYDLSKRLFIDLRPIRKLRKLENLNLSTSQVVNIQPIKRLKNLRHLNLQAAQVSDLKPIKGLKNLKSLYMRGCKNIKDDQVEELQKALPNLEITR